MQNDAHEESRLSRKGEVGRKIDSKRMAKEGKGAKNPLFDEVKRVHCVLSIHFNKSK